MELGATVCVPNGAPLCEQCPWNSLCLARKEGRIAELPVRTKAKARRIEKRTVLVIRDNDKVAIRKRPEKGLLAGLYELPNVEGRYSQDEIVHLVKEMHLSPIRVQKLENAKHIFSHIEWQMEGYAVLVEEAGFDTEAEKMAENHLIFVDAEKSQENYAIPSAFAAYAKYMGIRLGNEKFWRRIRKHGNITISGIRGSRCIAPAIHMKRLCMESEMLHYFLGGTLLTG